MNSVYYLLLLAFPFYTEGIPMKTAPYGTWTSPIPPEKVARGSVTITAMIPDGEDTYWCELRPQNRGRSTIVRRSPSGTLQDMTPPEFNVRSLVHEYGGGSFTVTNGVIYASNGSDSALYVVKAGNPPVKLTEGQTKVGAPGQEKWKGTRFADLHTSSHGLVAVGEHHEPGRPVENFLALIDTKSGKHQKIAEGSDFYSSPAVSKDGKQLAWISWNHPHMPWSRTELWTATIGDDGFLVNPTRIAGENPEAILSPQWAPDGTLYFVSDRNSGWWNIHRFLDGKIENVCPLDAEVGEPLWVFGRPPYAFLEEQIIFSFNSQGQWGLGILNPQTKQWQSIARPAVVIHQLRSSQGYVSYLEEYPDQETAIIQIKTLKDTPHTALNTNITITSIHQDKLTVDEGDISIGQHIEFPSGNRTAFGFYYPPCNKDFQGNQNTLPPLLVTIHGGPTAQAKSSFNVKHQYWTSRGFAILDVNYGGSTGYGRSYRQLLDHNWGIVDVEDCTNGALFLAAKGIVDRNHLFIRGGSAGGYTTLAVLTKTTAFRAAASYYGVADVTALALDTHKFEASYNDELLGKYPEKKELWEERSPIHSVHKISTPLIIFQGEQDTIVPKNQSIMIYDALKSRNIPVEMHLYQDEGHGFRQAATICHSLTKEAEFYLKTMAQ